MPASEYSAVDHLVVAGPDLALLVSMWREATGVDPVPGGAHTGMGTRNELVGVDATTYIELIGPDPEQAEPPGPRPFGIDDRTEPGFATFAIAVEDLPTACAAVRSAGIDPGEIRPMQRRRLDGVLLEWRLAVPPDPALGGVMPFLIEWGEATPHPAAGLEPEMTIAALALTHPEAAGIAAAVRGATGWDLPIETGPVSLTATVTCETAELTF